jgi:hypothetical protein
VDQFAEFGAGADLVAVVVPSHTSTVTGGAGTDFTHPVDRGEQLGTDHGLE